MLISLEALNRFQNRDNPLPVVNVIAVDDETLAAIRALQAEGSKSSMESNRDGRNRRAKAEAQA